MSNNLDNKSVNNFLHMRSLGNPGIYLPLVGKREDKITFERECSFHRAVGLLVLHLFCLVKRKSRDREKILIICAWLSSGDWANGLNSWWKA
jgi:hypothetical protein